MVRMARGSSLPTHLLYAVLFLWTDLVVAQERVDGSPTCGQCGLEFDTIAVLGGLESPGAGLITDLSRVAIGRDGRIHPNIVSFLR